MYIGEIRGMQKEAENAIARIDYQLKIISPEDVANHQELIDTLRGSKNVLKAMVDQIDHISI